MSQATDYTISNVSFANFRSELNTILGSINTLNSGTSAPGSVAAGSLWLDTTNATTPTLKFYDGSDQISLCTFNYSANTVNWLDSTVSADVVGDTTPQLGGDLDLNSNDITGTGNIAITGYVNARQNWESKSANFVAEAGKAYFCDTSGGAIDVTLPSPTIGDAIRFLDVAGTFDTNDLTILYGSSKIQGASANLDVATERAGFGLVYYNATQGWLLTEK